LVPAKITLTTGADVYVEESPQDVVSQLTQRDPSSLAQFQRQDEVTIWIAPGQIVSVHGTGDEGLVA
jgi:hypothetical protein